MDYGIVIPNRYPDIILPLLKSIEEFIPRPYPRIIIVADGHQEDYRFEMVPYPHDKFVYAKAVNLGINALGESNVVLLNDDCAILNYSFFEQLRAVSLTFPQIGILSPLIKGCAGNEVQRWWVKNRYWSDKEYLKFVHDHVVCFPCVYIKRVMINQIGLLDEGFVTYGGEDNEYCNRARRHGWVTAVTPDLVVQHGDGSNDMGEGRGRSWSLSYFRKEHQR